MVINTYLLVALIFLYFAMGALTYRIFLKLVWLSNDFNSEACVNAETKSVAFSVTVFWPIFLLAMGV